jgi:FixJ family two-component response regulator
VIASPGGHPAQRAEPTVFVVDDDVSVRESLELLIRTAGWRPELFSSARAFLAHRHEDGPRCLILDITLPDLNGLDLQRHLGGDQSYMPIIFITGHGDVPTSVRAMKAGAFEFLTKPFVDDVLLEAIQSAVGRSQRALREKAARQIVRDNYATLTPREQEVMDRVVCGLLNKQIGDELGISVITVEAHRGRVMRKMGVDSVADLVKAAAKLAPEPSPED